MAAVCAALLLPSASAETVFHVGPSNTTAAYLFDWQGHRATVVGDSGRVGASVTGRGATRTVTLDAPFVGGYAIAEPDCPDLESEIRREVLQLAVVRLSGTERRGASKVVEFGRETTLTGCHAGRVRRFGSLSDEGLATRHVADPLRPSLADLVPGTSLAGPSEQPDIAQPVADVVDLAAGAATFRSTGHVYAQSVADGWLLLDLSSLGWRGYARFSVDRNGAETWIAADWRDGVPVRVRPTMMVRPAPGAGFGGPLRASRIWESGLFRGTNNPFYFHLYRDGTGERVSKDLAQATESRMPVTWGFDGADVLVRRVLGSDIVALRRWVPLRNDGRARFVMESEVRLLPDGTSATYIPQRVNFYLDEGPAAPGSGR